MKKIKKVDIFDHIKIEKKWQSYWNKKKIYETTEKTLNANASGEAKQKMYILDMFPYPSGDGLHVGHPRGYIATDVYSRFKRMNGYSVLHPMGWDAFGLPAENHAIKNKINPAQSVKMNVKRFKDQLSIIGLSYDWNREINTTDPKYYKWTQWIFLQIFKKGLAYESFEPINWCPSCKTGLANEDVEDGKCERCGTTVEKKPMRQWVLKIREYADRLLEDLTEVKWPDHIKELQKNWIGRSEGAEISFIVKETKNKKNVGEVKVFTTRPDTLFGLSYVVIAPENKLVQEFKHQIKNFDQVEKYIQEAKKRSEIERTAEGKEKTGVRLDGLEAINPVNGEAVPVFVADYVLANYGTGSVMAVPAHDDRDYAFAKKYNLPITQVIVSCAEDKMNPPKLGLEEVKRDTVIVHLRDKSTGKYAILDWHGTLEGITTAIMGGIEAGQTPEEAALMEIKEEASLQDVKIIKRMNFITAARYCASHKNQNRCAHAYTLLAEVNDLKQQGKIAEDENKKHTLVWVNKEEVLDRLTPYHQKQVWKLLQEETALTEDGYLINSGKFDGMKNTEAMKVITEFAGGKITKTYKIQDWVFSRQRYWGEPIPVVHCEKCGVVPVPEKDLPVKLPLVKSYEPTGTGESPLAGIGKWVNTKCPQCKGKAKRETNTMPQWAGSSWYYLAYIMQGKSKVKSPKSKGGLQDYRDIFDYWLPVDMYVGGAEHATRHLIYARFWHKFLYDIGAVSTKEPFMQLRNQGMILGADHRKMSKRWGNVVNPDDVVKQVGADTLRVYESFMGPFDQEIAWSTDSMVGSRRFLDKVWKLQYKIADKVVDGEETENILHNTIKKVGEDISNFNANTAISSMMILVNHLEKKETVSKKVFLDFVRILSPFAPHICEELWSMYGSAKSITLENWPKYDEAKLISSKTKIAVQISGKVRGAIEVPMDSTEQDVVGLAKEVPEIYRWIEGKEIKKIIFVKNRILNFVL